MTKTEAKLTLMEQFPIAAFFTERDRVEVSFSREDMRPAVSIELTDAGITEVAFGYTTRLTLDQIEAVLDYARAIETDR